MKLKRYAIIKEGKAVMFFYDNGTYDLNKLKQDGFQLLRAI